MRRPAALAAAVLLALVALAALPGGRAPSGAQGATPAAAAAHPIVGAWRVVPDPPGPPLVLIVYHADGTLVFSGPASAPPPPGSPARVVHDTPAYGAWESTGERRAALTASLIETDENGAFLGTLTFHGTVEIDDTLDAYRFAGVVEVADASGAVVATMPVSTRATRIRVDLTRAMAAATPAAGTPAP